MSIAELTTYTPEDLLQKPDGDRYELVGGQLVETAHMGAHASWIAGTLHTMLNNYSERGKIGWAFTAEAGIQCFPDEPQKVRRPDVFFVRHVFFVRRGRFEGEDIPEGFVRIPPDVAAEVISPHDLYYAVDDKVQEYLEAGIQLVWVINPNRRTVSVYRSGGEPPSRLGERDELSGEEVLPGFRCPIASLFPSKHSTT